VLDGQTLAWVIDQHDAHLVSLDTSRDGLLTQVEFPRDLISERGFDPQLSAALYEALFAPLKP
jgi:hypothetical protein